MTRIRKIVLKVLKPEELELIDFTQTLSRNLGSAGVNIAIMNNYSDLEEIQVSIHGKNLNYEKIKSSVSKMGGKIHSIDEIHCGDFI